MATIEDLLSLDDLKYSEILTVITDNRIKLYNNVQLDIFYLFTNKIPFKLFNHLTTMYYNVKFYEDDYRIFLVYDLNYAFNGNYFDYNSTNDFEKTNINTLLVMQNI